MLDGITVGGENITLTSVIPGVPQGSLVALLDTGDPTALFSTKVQRTIYEKIPGAVSYVRGNERVWLVPCNTTTIVEFTFG